jgi:hypothetical protein
MAAGRWSVTDEPTIAAGIHLWVAQGGAVQVVDMLIAALDKRDAETGAGGCPVAEEWTEARVRERAGKHRLIPGVPVVWVRMRLSGWAERYVIEKSFTLWHAKFRDSSGWLVAHDDHAIPGERLAVDDLHPLGALYVAALDGDGGALLEAARRLRGEP